jgi:hypothetical protein
MKLSVFVWMETKAQCGGASSSEDGNNGRNAGNQISKREAKPCTTLVITFRFLNL